MGTLARHAHHCCQISARNFLLIAGAKNVDYWSLYACASITGNLVLMGLTPRKGGGFSAVSNPVVIRVKRISLVTNHAENPCPSLQLLCKKVQCHNTPFRITWLLFVWTRSTKTLVSYYLATVLCGPGAASCTLPNLFINQTVGPLKKMN